MTQQEILSSYLILVPDVYSLEHNPEGQSKTCTSPLVNSF